MGAVVFPIRDFYDQTSELVGIKSGLLLNDFSVNKILKEKFDDDFLEDENTNHIIRIRAEEIEAMIRHIRVRIGNLPEYSKINYYRVLSKYFKTPQDFLIHNKYSIYAMQQLHMGKELTYEALRAEISKNKNLNEELVEALAHTIVESFDNSISFVSSKSLDDVTPLQSLFELEIFPQSKNTFIDQKFLDYLAVNGNEIEEIHWRNFERFIAEYFQRQKLTVVLGPGTNDGGVDIRVFNEKESKDPLILIQCKRFKTQRKVLVETVKAFHSDVVFEKAKYGLIATTSRIAPGGKKIISARDYNISFAEKDKVKKWATTMWKHI